MSSTMDESERSLIIGTETAVGAMIGWVSPRLASGGPSLVEELRQHKDSAILELIETEEVLRNAASDATEVEAATNSLAEKKGYSIASSRFLDQSSSLDICRHCSTKIVMWFCIAQKKNV